MVKEISFLKGNLCIYKCFVDFQFILVSVSKKNYKIYELVWFGVVNFAVCSADFYLRKRIHDLISTTRIAFKD